MRGKHGGGEVGERNHHTRLEALGVPAAGYHYAHFLCGNILDFTVFFGDISDGARFDALRPTVMKRLEELRAQKVIGNSLEAEVELLTTDDELAGFLETFEDLAALCIVSKATVTRLRPGEATRLGPGQTAGLGEPAQDNLWVRVTRTSGVKCRRCWKYYDALSGSERHPEVCARCLEVLDKLET